MTEGWVTTEVHWESVARLKLREVAEKILKRRRQVGLRSREFLEKSW